LGLKSADKGKVLVTANELTQSRFHRDAKETQRAQEYR
jgi:hypothetical protein